MPSVSLVIAKSSSKEAPAQKALSPSLCNKMMLTASFWESVSISLAKRFKSSEGKEFALLEGTENVVVKIHDGKVDIGYEGGRGIQVIPSNGKIVLKASGATITISDDIIMSADNVRISSSSFHVTAGDVTITET